MTATDPRPFRFHCSTEVIPAEEVAVLVESGVLLEALAAGTVTPTTPEQVHFLLVDREEAEPETVAERARVGGSVRSSLNYRDAAGG